MSNSEKKKAVSDKCGLKFNINIHSCAYNAPSYWAFCPLRQKVFNKVVEFCRALKLLGFVEPPPHDVSSPIRLPSLLLPLLLLQAQPLDLTGCQARSNLVQK